MLPKVIIPCDTADPTRRSTWAFYGATQLLDMIGLSYRLADNVADCESQLIIDPAAGQICVNCEPLAIADAPIAPELRVQFKALFAPDPFGFAPQAAHLPIFGGMRDLDGAITGGALTILNSEYALSGPLYIYESVGESGFRITFNASIFETVGLYLSRFSWKSNPGFQGFVRYVDVLWEAVADEWGQCAVVNEYQDFFTALLRYCFERLGLVMATRWFHPCVDGQIRLSAMSVSHDVDSVYDDPAWRGVDDQTGNTHWNLDHWRKFENRFGVKSAFYFFAPHPEEDYWLQKPSYLVTDPQLLPAVCALAADGWEIAPHCLGYRTDSELSSEIAYFSRVTGYAPAGTRNHHLRHTSDSLHFKAAAGLTYDSTWYAEQTSSTLLTGTVLPYAPIDPASGLSAGIWEFGFVVEDGIVTGCYGIGTARDTAGGVADGVTTLNTVFAKNGYVCFNWHQRTFAMRTDRQREGESWVDMLAGLIEYFQAKAPDPWYPLLGELAHFWSLRDAVEVESCPERIIVRNVGAEDFPECVVALHSDRHVACDNELLLPARGICCIPTPLSAGGSITLPAP